MLLQKPKDPRSPDSMSSQYSFSLFSKSTVYVSFPTLFCGDISVSVSDLFITTDKVRPMGNIQRFCFCLEASDATCFFWCDGFCSNQKPSHHNNQINPSLCVCTGEMMMILWQNKKTGESGRTKCHDKNYDARWRWWSLQNEHTSCDT